jgi:hypothetical protein
LTFKGLHHLQSQNTGLFNISYIFHLHYFYGMLKTRNTHHFQCHVSKRDAAFITYTRYFVGNFIYIYIYVYTHTTAHYFQRNFLYPCHVLIEFALPRSLHYKELVSIGYFVRNYIYIQHCALVPEKLCLFASCPN